MNQRVIIKEVQVKSLNNRTKIVRIILPKDYVNYVKLTWVDSDGIERIIYPAIKTSDPLPILQDNNYEYLFDQQNSEILTAQDSVTKDRFQSTTGQTERSTNIDNADLIEENFPDYEEADILICLSNEASEYLAKQLYNQEDEKEELKEKCIIDGNGNILFNQE